MIPLCTRASVRELDRDAVARLGVPGLVLMENAGLGATLALMARFGECLGHVVVACGVGQNGGDGWVVARQLALRGVPVVAVLIGDEARVKGDAATNLAAARASGIRVQAGTAALESALATATLAVDALFGTGLDRPLAGDDARAVALLDGSGVPVVSLDLPSGIDADTAAVLGAAVHAALTITFAAHKRGLHQHPGVDHAGEVVLVSIGVEGPADAPAHLVDRADVAALVPARARDAHKGSAGHVLVVAGAPGRTGAALLAALGAARAGAGLVTIAASEPGRAALDAKVLEAMTAELPTHGAAEAALALAAGKSSAVVGPGVGTDERARALLVALAERLPIPAVLDADALTALAGDLARLRHAAAPRVLTPHPAEAARLLGVTTAEVQRDRYGAAERLARESGQVAILKGARTIVGVPDGTLYVIRAGTPALASAGTGDVLAGIVGALLSIVAPRDAAIAGAALHAVAGELAARSDRGLLAGEVAAALPSALEACREADR